MLSYSFSAVLSCCLALVGACAMVVVVANAVTSVLLLLLMMMMVMVVLVVVYNKDGDDDDNGKECMLVWGLSFLCLIFSASLTRDELDRKVNRFQACKDKT